LAWAVELYSSDSRDWVHHLCKKLRIHCVAHFWAHWETPLVAAPTSAPCHTISSTLICCGVRQQQLLGCSGFLEPGCGWVAAWALAAIAALLILGAPASPRLCCSGSQAWITS
jgi:hypothetical protein